MSEYEIYSKQATQTLEDSVLSVALRDEASLDTIVNTLTESHFLNKNNKALFLALSQMNQQSLPVDIITVHEFMSMGGELHVQGGELSFLNTIQATHGVPSNVDTYISLLNDQLTARRLTHIGANISLLAESHLSLAEKIEKSEALFAGLEINSKKKPSHVHSVLGEMVDKIEQRGDADDGLAGLSTGLTELDEAINGLQGGKLVIIGGRPAMGKSTLAENIVKANAPKSKQCLHFTIEMPNAQVAERMFAAHYGVDKTRLSKGMLNEDEWQKLTRFAYDSKHWGLYVDDDESLIIGDIIARSRAHKRKHGLDLIVIDYLQLIEGGEGETRSLRVGNISSRLKKLAKELDVPVVLLSQVSRNCESRPDKRPIMADLRESGSIEQDADIIMFVYRDEVYNADTQSKGIAEILIKKHRDGPVGDIFTKFQGHYCRFTNLQTSYEDYSQDGESWYS